MELWTFGLHDFRESQHQFPDLNFPYLAPSSLTKELKTKVSTPPSTAVWRYFPAYPHSNLKPEPQIFLLPPTDLL